MKKAIWWTLAYTILVILWGAWVRISHSGDGCGASWPLCQGELIPAATEGKTWVEYTHRLMSGVYGILIGGLAFYLHKRKDLAPQARSWMKLTLLFTITEALLGAKLVLFGLVGSNDTPYRAFVMSLHFFNSLLLTGSLTLTALFLEAPLWRAKTWQDTKGLSVRLLKRIPAGTVLLFLAIGITGTVAALSNTLYPPDSLLAGLLADIDSGSHYLVRLRGLHPVLGFSLGLGLTIFFYLASEAFGEGQKYLRNRAFALSVGIAFAVIAGSLTLLLHAPLPLKLLHLGLAHGVWILFLTFWHSLKYKPRQA